MNEGECGWTVNLGNWMRFKWFGHHSLEREVEISRTGIRGGMDGWIWEIEIFSFLTACGRESVKSSIFFCIIRLIEKAIYAIISYVYVRFLSHLCVSP